MIYTCSIDMYSPAPRMVWSPGPFPYSVTVLVVLPLLLATATTSAAALPDRRLGESHCDSSVDQLLGKSVISG